MLLLSAVLALFSSAYYAEGAHQQVRGCLSSFEISLIINTAVLSPKCLKVTDKWLWNESLLEILT